jgi:hypothetical protein
MGRLLWPLALIVTFFIGWGVAGVGRKPAGMPAADQQETVTRLQQQVETLQARLRAREELAAVRQSRSTADRFSPPGVAADERIVPQTLTRAGNAGSSPSATSADRASSSASASPAGAATVHAAHARF